MANFFENAQQLAALFTSPRPHDVKRDGKYLEGGLKPIEAFCGDIYQNLVAWATDSNNTVYYKTEKHWYVFHQRSTGGVVDMTRFDNNLMASRLDSFANPHSLANMREFRAKNKDKKVDLFKIN